jgi:hypothetical protein
VTRVEQAATLQQTPISRAHFSRRHTKPRKEKGVTRVAQRRRRVLHGSLTKKKKGVTRVARRRRVLHGSLTQLRCNILNPERIAAI